MGVLALIGVLLGAVLIFIIILAAVKKGIEEATYELKKDFFNDFSIENVNQDED